MAMASASSTAPLFASKRMAMASSPSRLQVTASLRSQPASLRKECFPQFRKNKKSCLVITRASLSAAANPSSMPLLFKSLIDSTRSVLRGVATAQASNTYPLARIGAPLFFATMTTVSTPLTVVASGMAKWLELYSAVLMIRVLLSWFPNIPWERQPFMAIRDMCDPYLNLFRNIIPPLFNALDLSPLLAFMVLGTLATILNLSAQG